jgi:hypothetical protein
MENSHEFLVIQFLCFSCQVFCNRILQSLNAVEDKESPQQEDNYSHCNGQKNEDLGP